MNKSVVRSVVPLVLAGMLVSGCGNSSGSKTVIIPDTLTAGEQLDAAVLFEVKQIYKVLQNDEDAGEVLGWLDGDRVLGIFVGKDRVRSVERVDYRNRSRQKTAMESETREIGELSPDGTQLALVENGKTSVKLVLTNVETAVETVVSDFSGTASEASTPSWSNNGRYAAYSATDRRSDTMRVVVYDAIEARSDQYPITGWKGRDGTVTRVLPSDDGKSALLSIFADGQPYVAFGVLNNDQLAIRYEHPLLHEDGADYVDDDRFLFVGSMGTLYAYDTRNASTTVILERVGSFRLSRDRKSIAYSKEPDSVYAAKLQGNSILYEKAVYKGVVSGRLDWSPDGHKLLVRGRQSVGMRPAVSAAAAPDHSPLIIEFK